MESKESSLLIQGGYGLQGVPQPLKMGAGMTGAGSNRVVMQMQAIGLVQTPSIFSAVCILGALKRKEDLQGMFVNFGDFIEFNGFSCGILAEQALLRKSKKPRKLHKN